MGQLPDMTSSLIGVWLLCRAGSSPQVVLMTDSVMEADQKTPGHGSSQRRVSFEAPESRLHEPSTPGKHKALYTVLTGSAHLRAPVAAVKCHMLS